MSTTATLSIGRDLIPLSAPVAELPDALVELLGDVTLSPAERLWMAEGLLVQDADPACRPQAGRSVGESRREPPTPGPQRPPKIGVDLLHDPRFNKGTAFTAEERDVLRIRGLLPPRVFTIEQQLERVMENFRRQASDLERYIFMVALQDRNETLFYRTVMDYLPEMMPVIYTPTLGEACQQFGHIFRRPRGLYISAEARGRVAEVLRNWPETEVAIIVVTDGERILGLGDLGTYGMGIPVGKLALYTACAGIHPSLCLPVMLDVGTDNPELFQDPLYTGLLQRRLRGREYAELLEEFVTAVQEVFPGALIQFEDFATDNAIGLLARYRDRVCAFNDDIQGTAAVTLAALLVSGRLTGRGLADQRLLFVGAGAAATGTAGLITAKLRRAGLTEVEARQRSWMFDAGGLLVASRPGVAAFQRGYAHDYPPVATLREAILALRPTALIGVSGQPELFTEPVLQAMAEVNERPVVFALSNPTSRAECTAEQAYRWTGGRAVFSSGSPCGPVEVDGRRFVPSQANNAYIFPGLGLGVVAAGARRVTDTMLLAAAGALADQADEDVLREGTLFPPLRQIREVSVRIAAAVARVAVAEGLATHNLPRDLEAYLDRCMYQPVYRTYLV
jgi:malate dehydrogenase (oxaloacetate-decarboxylating)(NADP+)